MRSSASFNRTVAIVAKLELDDPSTSKLTYPKKLTFRVTNPTASVVLITSLAFEAQTSTKPRLFSGQRLGASMVGTRHRD
jgi:hypothetical protein